MRLMREGQANGLVFWLPRPGRTYPHTATATASSSHTRPAALAAGHKVYTYAVCKACVPRKLRALGRFRLLLALPVMPAAKVMAYIPIVDAEMYATFFATPMSFQLRVRQNFSGEKLMSTCRVVEQAGILASSDARLKKDGRHKKSSI